MFVVQEESIPAVNDFDENDPSVPSGALSLTRNDKLNDNSLTSETDGKHGVDVFDIQEVCEEDIVGASSLDDTTEWLEFSFHSAAF